MSSAGISFGGLASGLDTKAIISALVAVEQRPIRALETKKTSFNKQKSLYGDLRGLLDKLSTAAKALKTTSDFLAMKASSDDENVMTATASSTAVPGTYTARVLSLAKAQVNASTGRASATESLGGPASLMLEVGGNTILIGVASPTLENIAAAINAEDDLNETGVRAEVVDTGNTGVNAGSRYQLVVRSTQVGAAGSFVLSVDDGDQAFQDVINSVAANRRIDGTDARLELYGGSGGSGGSGQSSGVIITRPSNTISDLWPGITLELKSEAFPTKDVTITVNPDSEATAKKVQDYVDAYNKVVDFFTEQSALDAEGKAKSPLFGDQTLRSLRSTLRTTIGGSVSGTGNPAFQMLSQVGITSDTAGKLTFNKSKFEEALADDEDAVAKLFTDPQKGVATTLIDKIDVYTDSVDGLIKTRSDTFDRQVKQTQSRIDNAERRLVIYQKQLEAKYASLENLLGKLQSQGSAVNNIR